MLAVQLLQIFFQIHWLMWSFSSTFQNGHSDIWSDLCILSHYEKIIFPCCPMGGCSFSFQEQPAHCGSKTHTVCICLGKKIHFHLLFKWRIWIIFPGFNVLLNQQLSWPLMAICVVLLKVFPASSSYISFFQLRSLNFTFTSNFIGDLLSLWLIPPKK